MRINITAGDVLNKLLVNKYQDEYFIPFNEAMIEGKVTTRLFSKEFIKERAIVHNVSEEEYKLRLLSFLTFLDKIIMYNEVVLWFGSEPFCLENTRYVLRTLKEYWYNKKIILNIVG